MSLLPGEELPFSLLGLEGRISQRFFALFHANSYGGFSQGTERCLHHYGAPLNSIPVLDAYRASPDDTYLLTVGIGAVTGTLTAIVNNGSSTMAWHGAANLLVQDPTNCDYGVGFYGHARNVGMFVVSQDKAPVGLSSMACYLCDGTVGGNCYGQVLLRFERV